MLSRPSLAFHLRQQSSVLSDSPSGYGDSLKCYYFPIILPTVWLVFLLIWKDQSPIFEFKGNIHIDFLILHNPFKNSSYDTSFNFIHNHFPVHVSPFMIHRKSNSFPSHSTGYSIVITIHNRNTWLLHQYSIPLTFQNHWKYNTVHRQDWSFSKF